MVTSDRAGNPDIWSLPAEGGEMQHVVADPAPDWGASWSPDTRTIAFFSYRSGNRDIWTTPVSGGAARQLTNTPAADLLPSWSPDGKSIAFLSDRDGSPAVWIVPSEGGPLRRVKGSRPMLSPRWSPNGVWLAVLSDGSLWRVSPTDPDQEIQVARDVRAAVWAPDSGSLYFNGGRQSRTISVVSANGTTERPIANLSGRRGTLGEGVGTDGRYVFFTWQEDLGDVWVMDVVSKQTARR